jgi:ribonuclease J
VVQLGYQGLPRLIDLRPPPDSVYAHSNGPPLGTYDPTYRVMEAWVRQLELRFLSLGSSGHSWPADITRMVRAVGPGVVLPVHSRAPEALAVPDVRVLLPEAGRVYTRSALMDE